MEDILHQLIGSLSHYSLFAGFYTSQVVQDFFHQQYVSFREGNSFLEKSTSIPEKFTSEAVQNLAALRKELDNMKARQKNMGQKENWVLGCPRKLVNSKWDITYTYKWGILRL